MGYGWENHRTFVSKYGDPERDRLCRAAFGHYEKYFLLVRGGSGEAAAEQHLEAYDRAAQAAVEPVAVAQEDSVSAVPLERRPWVPVSAVSTTLDPAARLHLALGGDLLLRAMQDIG